MRSGPNFMYTAALLSIAGSHLLVFGFLAKLYTHQIDPVFEDPRIARLMSRFSVERGLCLGGGLVIASAAPWNALAGPLVPHPRDDLAGMVDLLQDSCSPWASRQASRHSSSESWICLGKADERVSHATECARDARSRGVLEEPCSTVRYLCLRIALCESTPTNAAGSGCP